MTIDTHLVTPEEIMALLDGELSAERTQFVSAHLEECPDCRNFADSFRGDSQTLSNWAIPLLSANPHFEAGLAEAARRASSEDRAISSRAVPAFLSRHWLLTAAASALTAVLALSLSTVSFRPMEVMKHRSKTIAQVSDPNAPMASFGAGGGAGVAGNPKTEAPANNGYQSWVENSNMGVVQEQRISPESQGSRADALDTPMIARTVGLSVVTEDFSGSRAALDAIVARHHGYAASLNANTQENAARSLQVSLRIPATELSATVSELKSLGRVENETQSGEEVTQQHADLVARLKNSRETEQRLQAILEQRTGRISDVLAVEREIARVRGEIEQMEAEQKSLEHRVDFADVELALVEEYQAQIGSPSPAISTRVHNGLVTGYRDAVETVVGIVLFFAMKGPSLLLWLVVLLPVALLLRRIWLRTRAAVSSVGL